MKKNKIYLIGYMGTGKSTVGRRLAERMSLGFVDLDKEAERREALSVSEIFRRKGEEYFRGLETELLGEISGREKGFVVACGGGLALREENRKILKASGTTLQLCASPESICERLARDNSRPLLFGLSPEEKLEKVRKMQEERRLFYAEAADIFINTDGRSKGDICAEILRRLRKRGSVHALFPGKNAGAGKGPLICSPVAEKSEAEILACFEKAERLKREKSPGAPDMLELRVDSFKGYNDRAALKALFSKLSGKKARGEYTLPAIFTFRTEDKAFPGGASAELSEFERAYESCLSDIIELSACDFVDIEIERKGARELLARAKRSRKRVILSKHDFEKTPLEEDILRQLVLMQEYGADVCKAAYMPGSAEDAERVLSAARRMYDKYADRPFVLISMGELGKKSRLSGLSAFSFASMEGKGSAPGQLGVEELRRRRYAR